MSDAMRREMQIVLPVTEPADKDVDLRSIVAGILTAKRWIATGVLLGVTGGGLYVLATPPEYQADVLMRVQQQLAPQNAKPDDVANIFASQTAVRTEMSIINSRAVIGEAVRRLHLDIQAKPHHLPVIGTAVQRVRELAGIWFGLPDWRSAGHSQIQVRRFDVPEGMQGKVFQLQALEGGRFRLMTPYGVPLGEGTVGQPLRMGGGSTATPATTIDVSALQAPAGTRFDVTRLRPADAITAVQQKMGITELDTKTSGEAQETGGVLQILLNGPESQMVARTLNLIADISLQQNIENRSMDAERKLAFIEQQLPQARARLVQAQAALSTFQQRNGTVDTDKESEAGIRQEADVDKELLTLEMQRTELRQKFTDQHPALIALNQKIHDLEAQRTRVRARMQQMPTLAQDTTQLKANLKAASDLYDSLSSKYQELKMVQAGALGNLQLIDSAMVPDKPVKPHKSLILAACGLAGLFAGILMALASSMRRRVSLTPDFVERDLGLPVLAAIPHSRLQARLPLLAGPKGQAEARLLLAERAPADLAVEHLRGLRACLEFARRQAANNVVTVTGSSRHAGKSFVATNLARLLAAAGKRVLLVDADMRQGRLASFFNLPAFPGLSEVLTGQVPAEDASQRTGVPGFDLLAAGHYPMNPSELLMHDAFAAFLETLRQHYDYVVCDTPPVLEVADSFSVCALAGTNLLVASPDSNSAEEIEVAVKKLGHAGVTVHGVVLNDLKLNAHPSIYGQSAYLQAAYETRNRG